MVIDFSVDLSQAGVILFDPIQGIPEGMWENEDEWESLLLIVISGAYVSFSIVQVTFEEKDVFAMYQNFSLVWELTQWDFQNL